MNAMPALLGGKPIRPEGPPPWPMPDEEVLQAFRTVYNDGTWGQYRGASGERLEAALRDYFQTEYVATCCSGTFAMEMALRGLGIRPGDEVILAAYDYPGNFLNIHAVGAQPVLVDVDPDNWNMAVALLPAAIGPRTRAVIVSHLHGGLVPIHELVTIARHQSLAVIEDAAQVPGAVVQGKKAGTWGDAGVLSFGGSKLVSAGRGGALLTARSDVYQRARTWNTRGNLVGAISEMQAAVIEPQLRKLDERNALRARNVRTLLDGLHGIPGLRPLKNRNDAGEPGYYKLGLQFDAQEFGVSRQRFVQAMQAEGIGMDEGFHALHIGRSPRRFRLAGPLTEANRAHHGMVVLHHPVLLGGPNEIEQVVAAVRKTWHNRMKLSATSCEPD
jgi:dTDP-4-amino-4,6-dideoxygalactose transaminase